jgi:hypothetical protein
VEKVERKISAATKLSGVAPKVGAGGTAQTKKTENKSSLEKVSGATAKISG